MTDRVRNFIWRINRAAPFLMDIIFTRGGCYQFHLLLKDVFGSRNVTMYVTVCGGHAVSKIGGKFWDINGEWDVEKDGKLRRPTRKEKEGLSMARCNEARWIQVLGDTKPCKWKNL